MSLPLLYKCISKAELIDRYIGGATLIEDKSLLVSAAEILTVEARSVVLVLQ